MKEQESVKLIKHISTIRRESYRPANPSTSSESFTVQLALNHLAELEEHRLDQLENQALEALSKNCSCHQCGRDKINTTWLWFQATRDDLQHKFSTSIPVSPKTFRKIIFMEFAEIDNLAINWLAADQKQEISNPTVWYFGLLTSAYSVAILQQTS